ncbi:MAG: hypothetical protein AAGA81_12955 [Acidobacteriota bacterium]
MSRQLKKLLALSWAALPPLALSALVHTTDRDVGGLGGLVEPSVLLSVLVYGSPLAGLAICLLWMAVKVNRWLAAAVLATCSALLGLAIVTLGSTAQTLPQLLWSFSGTTVVVVGFFAFAVVPSWRLWPIEGQAS